MQLKKIGKAGSLQVFTLIAVFVSGMLNYCSRKSLLQSNLSLNILSVMTNRSNRPACLCGMLLPNEQEVRRSVLGVAIRYFCNQKCSNGV